ncbi:MAG TPA: YtxH domain-containing protein [Candidatus Angelobacter sp.]|nr:YtxH domain-containing protein [Candidatus Angelobacter sp.]
MNAYERYGDYAQLREERERSGAGAGTIITFLLLGAGIGAALACLFTPRRGDELRNAIGRGYRRTVDGVSQRTRELRDRGSNLLGFERGGEAEKQYGQG